MKSRGQQKQEYTQSPWSGETYTHPPSIDELTTEGGEVLQRHPAIAKAVNLEAMGKFIAQYKAQHGIK